MKEEEIDESKLPLPHSHCNTCYKLSCKASVDNVNTCPVVECEQRCGSKFHQCKQKEHKQLCSHEKVPCINSVYGCPLLIARSKINCHLEVCPASVIHCSAEWNRWPLYSHDSQKKVTLPKVNPKFHYGQLDVALAMRDQRMLIKSMNAPRKTRKILRNPLTSRHPAVPIAHRSNSLDSDNLLSEGTSQTLSDDDCDAPWEVSKSPPGLQKSVCSRLYTSSEDTTTSLSEALKSSRLYTASKETTTSLSQALDYVSNHMAGINQLEEVSELYSISEDFQKLNADRSSKSEGCTSKLNAKCHSDISEEFSSNKEVECPDEVKRFSKLSTEERGTSTSEVDVPCSSVDNFENLYTNQTKLADIISVDLRIESITKYQAKAPSMFTFLCAQEFRRDEYPWHHKNVHNDIHSGLDGWMEERCPLAYLGCTFSFSRFYPNTPETTITHSTLLESFGSATSNNIMGNCDFNTMKSNNNVSLDQKDIRNLREATPEVFTSFKTDSLVKILPCYDSDSLSREMSPVTEQTNLSLSILCLPFEILQYIAIQLDGFSLCNLSLTCKHFREVCRSLLDYRGIVVQVWERRKTGSKPLWIVSHMKWQFSTAFTPVRKWGFRGHSPISEHLKICPFNQEKTLNEEPFKILTLYQSDELSEEKKNLLKISEDPLMNRSLHKDFWLPVEQTDSDDSLDNLLV